MEFSHDYPHGWGPALFTQREESSYQVGALSSPLTWFPLFNRRGHPRITPRVGRIVFLEEAKLHEPRIIGLVREPQCIGPNTRVWPRWLGVVVLWCDATGSHNSQQQNPSHNT